MQIGEWAFVKLVGPLNSGRMKATNISMSPLIFLPDKLIIGNAKIIVNALKITGLNPRYLDLEISETTVINNVELAASIVDNIKSMALKLRLIISARAIRLLMHFKLFPINTFKDRPVIYQAVFRILRMTWR